MTREHPGLLSQLVASWSSSDHLEYLGIPELPGETGASQGPSGVPGDHLGPLRQTRDPPWALRNSWSPSGPLGAPETN